MMILFHLHQAAVKAQPPQNWRFHSIFRIRHYSVIETVHYFSVCPARSRASCLHFWNVLQAVDIISLQLQEAVCQSWPVTCLSTRPPGCGIQPQPARVVPGASRLPHADRLRGIPIHTEAHTLIHTSMLKCDIGWSSVVGRGAQSFKMGLSIGNEPCDKNSQSPPPQKKIR